MTTSKLKRLRRQTQTMAWLQRKTKNKHFSELTKKVEVAFTTGQPIYEYQLKPGQIKEHMAYWQQHPQWGELIWSVMDKPYTATNVTLVLYFRNR